MQTLKLADIKKELQKQSPAALIELCLSLSKFKKENKELLTYLLMDAGNEEGYIASCKLEVDDLFEEINKSNTYLVKKSLRKVLRVVAKRIKYSGKKETEIELLMYFIQKSFKEKINPKVSQVIHNLFLAQLKKINKALSTLHEDLQFDYRKELVLLENKIL